ncbi:telomeric DNA binding protein [Trametes polyzona]|nr:telomeric DNA binding protein [Trametes polyzona]
MSAKNEDSADAQMRDIVSRLQSPRLDYSTTIALLVAPLASVGLLPPRFNEENISPIPEGTFVIGRHASLMQRAILQNVIPKLGTTLRHAGDYELVEQYFYPNPRSFASPAARQLALQAYSTILSFPLRNDISQLLANLTKAYPIDILHDAILSDSGQANDSGRHAIIWEDCVRDVLTVSMKVANFMAEGGDAPPVLEHGVYIADVSVRTEHLVYRRRTERSQDQVSSIAFLLGKLINVGAFPSSIPASPAQPSFFQATLPTIRLRLAEDGDRGDYSRFWKRLLASLPSAGNLRSILTSLFVHLAPVPSGLDGSSRTRGLVAREASLVHDLLGPFTKDNSELVDCFTAVALIRNWDEGRARIFACWAAGAQKDSRDREGLDILRRKVLDVWTDADHIRHSLLSHHRYLTLLLLATLRYSPSPSPAHDLALSPSFVKSISTYISHLDPSIRRCGMLVAEEVARAAGKTLDFGDWAGDEQGKPWCRQLRELLKECDVDADAEVAEPLEADVEQPTSQPLPSDAPEPTKAKVTVGVPSSGYDSDDSLTGYASPASSRSASPTPSELEEIERDPTIRVGAKKVPRPVYLAQLGEMLRPTGGLQSGDEQLQATKVEVALEVAEELIRRKSGYGTELEENAVNLVHGLVGLQDNYELDGFDQKRQAALNALVACCPRKAAPAIIEEFFRNQYSTDQRFVMLNALALGARELASLPVPELPGRPALPSEKVAFPSKRLPPAQHKKYITAGDQSRTNDPVHFLLEGISQQAIDKGREATADRVPELVRERNLRVRPSSKISEVPSDAPSRRAALMRQLAGPQHPKRTTFTEVAAEYFICPLVNRFWLFLRDEQTREARTAHQPMLHQYRSAGTGLVLSALVLGRLLETLAVLVHASRNAREWLAVIAPDTLELAVTVGTRPLSRGESADDDEAGPPGEPKQSKEAALLTAALELALIVLDGCLDVDGGKSLGLEHTVLLLGTGEWAGKVFESIEEGIKVLGGGGAQEARLSRAAAAVVLKVDEMTSRWRRSMIDLV